MLYRRYLQEFISGWRLCKWYYMTFIITNRTCKTHIISYIIPNKSVSKGETVIYNVHGEVLRLQENDMKYSDALYFSSP